uniref:ENPP1-3/EXOG-like endonuclease/phosphodiesterase domain-containing protein n=1 Tax=Sinocyclocheilus rhinocerous TaxID=307959 RepID=A0A673IY47_9TELE
MMTCRCGEWVSGSQATKNYPGAPADLSGTNVSAASESEKADETICIRIPFSAMFSSGSPVSRREAQQPSQYKLINGFPSDTDLKIRKSYALSFDTETKNAEWVYEILNKETIVKEGQKTLDKAMSKVIWLQLPITGGVGKQIIMLIYKNEICNVHVYTGPLYLRPMDHSVLGGKRVPSHLFKVIIVENVNGTVEEPKCYMTPNETPQTNNSNDCKVNTEDIQRFSGLKFIEHRPNKNIFTHY